MNFDKIYEYRFKHIDQTKKLAVWKEIASFIHKQMGNPKTVLDPCAGRCEFINFLKSSECWAVDREPTVIQYKAEHVKFIQADIFDVSLPDDFFEGIFVSNFLEHLGNHDAVATFLAKMYKTLKNNGKLVIMGPNFKYCAKSYFDCCDHNLILTNMSVAEFLYSENFAIKKNYRKFLPFSFRSHFPASAFLTKLYLKFPLLWRLLGKQFLLIAEK